MSRLALLLGCTLLAASCQPRTSTAQARFYHDGRQKPVVAVVPVFDHTTPTVEWDLSEELTQEIEGRLLKKDHIFLTQQEKVRSFIKDLRQSQNPFALDVAWVKPAFTGQDFVVFMELLQHEETPIKNAPQEDPKRCSAELNISLRVRVLDLRGEIPTVVLQEIIRHNHHLPRQFNKYNFYQDEWGDSDFAISTLGLAHAQLTKEAASRIEEYILLARGNL
jgi:hypothetical protein